MFIEENTIETIVCHFTSIFLSLTHLFACDSRCVALIMRDYTEPLLVGSFSMFNGFVRKCD